MWPFKKQKHKKLECLNSIDHSWSVFQVDGQQGLMIIRLNETAKEWAKHPKLNARVGFAIPLKNQNLNGLPDPKENEAFNEIEDSLVSIMNETGASIQVIAITTGTFKEFVFYIENASAIEQAHKKAMALFPDYDVQCYGEYDPNWLGYFQWQKS